MQKCEFDRLVARERVDHPRWFDLDMDGPADTTRIRAAEAVLGVDLPRDYVDFLCTHGGGYFALALVFGVVDGTPWSVVDNNRHRVPGFVGVSSNGTGDLYGYLLPSGLGGGREIALFDHESGRVTTNVYPDLYELLSRHAFLAD